MTTQTLTRDLRRERGAYADALTPWNSQQVPDGTPRADTSSFLYVNDTTLFEAVPMDRAILHITASKTQEELVDLPIGDDFAQLSTRAEDRGIRINTKKTQLLVISPMNGCQTGGSFIGPDGQPVTSVPKLKLVGFTFGDDPGAGVHVESIKDQYRRISGCCTTSAMLGSRDQTSSSSTAAMSAHLWSTVRQSSIPC